MKFKIDRRPSFELPVPIEACDDQTLSDLIGDVYDATLHSISLTIDLAELQCSLGQDPALRLSYSPVAAAFQ
jgi:hypothetical protein